MKWLDLYMCSRDSLDYMVSLDVVILIIKFHALCRVTEFSEIISGKRKDLIIHWSSGHNNSYCEQGWEC